MRLPLRVNTLFKLDWSIFRTYCTFFGFFSCYFNTSLLLTICTITISIHIFIQQIWSDPYLSNTVWTFVSMSALGCELREGRFPVMTLLYKGRRCSVGWTALQVSECALGTVNILGVHRQFALGAALCLYTALRYACRSSYTS